MTAMLLVVGCGSDAPNSSGGDESAEAPVELPPMHVVAGLGYPRDLLDRGRVHIRIDRADDLAVVWLDKQLVAARGAPYRHPTEWAGRGAADAVR